MGKCNIRSSSESESESDNDDEKHSYKDLAKSSGFFKKFALSKRNKLKELQAKLANSPHSYKELVSKFETLQILMLS